MTAAQPDVELGPPSLDRLAVLARQYQLQHSSRRTAIGDQLAAHAAAYTAWNEDQYQRFLQAAAAQFPEFGSHVQLERLRAAVINPDDAALQPSGDPPPEHTQIGVILAWLAVIALVVLALLYVAAGPVKP